MTSHDREFMNRLVTKIVEIDGGELIDATRATTTSTSSSARIAAAQQEAQYARQQAMLAKEEAFIARFKARASHAAQVQSRVKKLEKIEQGRAAEDAARWSTSTSDAAALGRRRREARAGRASATAIASIYDGPRPPDPPARALVRDGRQRRRQVHAAQARRRRSASPTRASVTLGASVKMGYFAQHAMELLDPTQTVLETLERAFPRASRRLAAHARSARSASRATTSTSRCRVLSGGEKARARARAHAVRPAELPRARRADQPPRPRHQGDAHQGAREFEGTMLFVSHDRHFLARALATACSSCRETKYVCTQEGTLNTSRNRVTRPQELAEISVGTPSCSILVAAPRVMT